MIINFHAEIAETDFKTDSFSIDADVQNYVGVVEGRDVIINYVQAPNGHLYEVVMHALSPPSACRRLVLSWFADRSEEGALKMKIYYSELSDIQDSLLSHIRECELSGLYDDVELRPNVSVTHSTEICSQTHLRILRSVLAQVNDLRSKI